MPLLASFVESADADSPFPLNNLPYGVRRVAGGAGHVVVAIGDFVLDLAELAARAPGAFLGEAVAHNDLACLFGSGSLNVLLERGPGAWAEVRASVTDALSAAPARFVGLRDDAGLRAACLLPRDGAELVLPLRVGDYTDFYSSVAHATNVGTMFRGPENALLPNWRALPVAYHGRASSVVVSGTPVRRPAGQLKPADGPPVHAPARLLDFELEFAAVIGGPENALGDPVRVEDAAERVFGYALLNDWSARDVQKWEYVPLGPFGAKNFATTLGAWVVPAAALAPFAVEGPAQDPPVLGYLRDDTGRAHRATFDIALSVGIAPAGASRAETVCETNFRHVYWSVAQQIAHHTVTGCNLRAGDLLASGTISGDTDGSLGSLLELSWKGTRAVALGRTGQTRKFLRDGDTVHLAGECRGDGYRIGFGACAGTVLPAHPL